MKLFRRGGIEQNEVRGKNVEMNFDRTTAIESLKNDSKLLWIMVDLVSSI